MAQHIWSFTYSFQDCQNSIYCKKEKPILNYTHLYFSPRKVVYFLPETVFIPSKMERSHICSMLTLYWCTSRLSAQAFSLYNHALGVEKSSHAIVMLMKTRPSFFSYLYLVAICCYSYPDIVCLIIT